MSFFTLGPQRALLAVNNEYTNLDRLYAHDGTVISAQDALKARYAHGISIFEIESAPTGYWKVLQDSHYNRRLHAQTPIEITGPAAGNALLRTALGRFAHENAALTINADDHVVVYMGDDSRGEHIYRFVSRSRIDPQNDPQNDAHNPTLLVEGTLFAAHFDAEPGELQGTGRWLALLHGHNGLTADVGFADQAEVLIHARLATTRAGATTMDRPEWIAVQPNPSNVYCSLTNNSNRGVQDNQPVDGPNPRARNSYGQIIRWTPEDGDHTNERFTWDLFVIAGNPVVHPDSLLGGCG